MTMWWSEKMEGKIFDEATTLFKHGVMHQRSSLAKDT